MSTPASSSRFSRFSRRARVIDYYKLAHEVINGKPIGEIEDRDLRPTIVSLCVIRSQSGAAFEVDRAEEIAELIRTLNKRVQPPAFVRRGGAASSSSPSKLASSGSPSKLTSPISKSPVKSPEITQAERDDLQRSIDALVAGDQVDLDEDPERRRKLVCLIDGQINVALTAFDYAKVQRLHTIADGP
jgi:hypothetical protein